MPKAPTPVGTLRHRIIIQTLSQADDGQGGFTDTWATHATVWARIEPTAARERNFADQIQYQRSHKVTLRYLSTITNTMRISYGGRIFQIKGVRALDERKYYMILDVEENQGS